MNRNSKLENLILVIFNILLIVMLACSALNAQNIKKHHEIAIKYDNRNRPIEIMGPGNRKAILQYDRRGQLESIINNDEKQVFKYNKVGILNYIKDNTGETIFECDSWGRMKKMVYPNGETITYEYYENGDIASVEWENRHFLRFCRDLLGNTVIMDSPVGKFNINYDYDKRIMQRVYPNGASYYVEYNPDGRPVFIQHATPDRRIISEFRYVYNDAGLLEKAHEYFDGTDLEINYVYDVYGQLLQASYSDGRRYIYEYDDFGNRVKYSDNTDSITASYDGNDQFESLNGNRVECDEAGNITGLGNSKFSYNDNNALIEDGKRSYKYNALGLRVEASGQEQTIRFLHLLDDLFYVLAETGDTNKRYLWIDGQCVGQIEDDNRVLFFFEDHLGSIRSAMDLAGNIVGYAEYTPFGKPERRISGVRFGFAGEEQDDDSKVYLRARYYVPETGRFLSKDPTLPDLMSEYKQNRYAYAANSPLNYKDRDGTYPVWDWEKFKSGWYVGTGFGDYATQYWANRYVQTGNWLYTIPGFFSALWTSDTYWKTSLTLGGGWAASKIIPLVNSHLIVKGTLAGSKWEPFHLNILGKYVHYGIGRYGPHIGIGLGGSSFFHYYASHINIGGARGVDLAINQMLPAIPDAINNLFDKVSEIKKYFVNTKSDDSFYPPPFSYLNEDRNKFYPFIPPPPPPTGGAASFYASSIPIQTPNVGGVYLDKAAEVIGHLSTIEGVSFDPVSNRIILIGNETSDISLPSIRLDDLAAAFRAVFSDYLTEPGVSIDPDSSNPMADSMYVRFFGGMANTHFGYVLFEADRTMKSLSLGKDTITRDTVKVTVKDYYNMLDLCFSNLGGKYSEQLWSRFWLVPEQVIVQVSDDRKTITFPDTRIRVKTETMKWENGKLVPAKDQQDEKAEYFAAHFTHYYDDYAKEFPVFNELKTLANLVALVKWLKENGSQIELDWIEKFDTLYTTPEKTPSLKVADERFIKQNGTVVKMGIKLFGGTDLTVKNIYVKDDGRSGEFGNKANKVISTTPGIAAKKFFTDAGAKKVAVVLPSSQMRAGGAKMIRAQELNLLTRSFCSFHNDLGPFGYSWVLDLPVLKFINTNRDKMEYVGIDSARVIIRNYRLTAPYGLQDIIFEKYVADHEYDKVAYLPDKNVGIRALYPDDDSGEYRIEYKDGTSEIFNSHGNLIRRQINPSMYFKFSYGNPGNYLENVVLMRNDNIVENVTLFYNKNGWITSAQTSNNNIKYSYDREGNLIKVASGEEIIEYTYDNRHLVTHVFINGNLKSTYAYDDLGRVVQQKSSEENPLPTTIEIADGKTIITDGRADSVTTRSYDRGGRLLEFHDPAGTTINANYYDSGSLKEVTYANQYNDTTKIEYSPDARFVKYTDAGGTANALLFDEFGRLKQIQDENNLLLNKEYKLTDQGWYESTESAEIKVHNLFNTDRKLIEEVIDAKTPWGGQLMTLYDYDSSGQLLTQNTKGLFNERLFYKGGNLTTQISGPDSISFCYDQKGRLNEMLSGRNRFKLTYEQDNSINNMTLNYNDLKVAYGFQNNNLIKRSNNKGLNDIFSYDINGYLKNVNRNNSEIWDIVANQNKTTYYRNGVVQFSLLRK